MAGRTLFKWGRVYIDGYDMSGYDRAFGPFTWAFDEADMTAPQSDAAKGYLPNTCSIGCGTLNGLFDTTATVGFHTVMSSIQSERIITYAMGDRAAPAAGVPVFAGQWVQDGYHAEDDSGAMVASVPFGAWDAANQIGYTVPWGYLLHANSAAAAANSSGDAQHDNGASSALGGYMVVHGLAGDGTATITVQHSADEVDGNYANLGGCTSGELDFSSVQSVVAATTAKTTTVERYIRWQISLNTATTVTFVLSFIRGIH